jgi:hypothetical protein
MTEPTITLKRFIVTARPRTLSPYRRVDGEWVTNNKRVRVRRVKGLSMAVALRYLHGYASLLTAAELEFVKTIARKRGWILTIRTRTLTIPRWAWLDGDLDCSQDLLDRLNRVGKDLQRTVFVRSGRRTLAEQWELYRRLGPGIAAYPSATAPHVRGVAADCGIDGRDIGEVPGARNAMRRHGVCLPVPREDWHVEVGNEWNA